MRLACLAGLFPALPAIALALVAVSPVHLQADDPDAEMNAFIDDLLARMTLGEKLGQLNQSPGRYSDTGPAMPKGGPEDVRAGRIGSFLSVYGAKVTREWQRLAVEESRLGIPLLFADDVLHGFRTIFPVPLASASSWNPEAIGKAARIAAVEASAHGVHWTYAPMIDITRDPRWGRVVEGSGEDPFLSSAIAAAQVRGFQGADLAAEDTLLASAKHFAAYGGAEAGRDYNTVDISDRTLHEVYLPPFRAALDAGVASFMAAFNEIGGIPAHSSHYLFREILREKWQFDGIAVSDYTGIEELMDHGVAANRLEAGIIALESGIDVDMASGIYRDLAPAIRSGKLDETLVNEATRRVLETKYRLGLFDDPYRYSDPRRQAERTLTPEHRQAARQLAEQSIVLLKNLGPTLPFSGHTPVVAVIGPLADDPHSALGPWSAAGRAEDAVTVLEGIRRRLPDADIQYVRGSSVDGSDKSGFERAAAAAGRADAVVLVLGEHRDMSGEAKSRTSLALPGVQRELAQAVLGAGTPTVVVLMNGRPLSVSWLDEHAPAILEAWYLGVETGNAVARVLFGDVNPSGKLPITVPRTVGQVPIYYNQRNTGRSPDPLDPYTSKYLKTPTSPLYVFGHGLSYTRFTYDHLRLSAGEIAPEESVRVEVEVNNVGRRAGTEVVQLYLQDLVGSATRPVRELRGFRRVPLGPGESRTVTFTLGPDELASFDRSMRRRVEPGKFRVYVGTDSLAELAAEFQVTE